MARSASIRLATCTTWTGWVRLGKRASEAGEKLKAKVGMAQAAVASLACLNRGLTTVCRRSDRRFFVIPLGWERYVTTRMSFEEGGQLSISIMPAITVTSDKMPVFCRSSKCRTPQALAPFDTGSASRVSVCRLNIALLSLASFRVLNF